MVFDSGTQQRDNKKYHKPHAKTTTPNIYQHKQQELLARHKRYKEPRRKRARRTTRPMERKVEPDGKRKNIRCK